jgi:hypothetical protein
MESVQGRSIPRLSNPLLLIPGGTSQKFGLRAIARYLQKGGNNRYVGDFQIGNEEKFIQQMRNRSGNMASLYYSREFGSLEGNAQEIKAAVDSIREATGSDKVDIVAECKGAIETREYLKEGGDHVGNFILLVPPNHGIPIGIGSLWPIIKMQKFLHFPFPQVRGYSLTPETGDTILNFRPDFHIGKWHTNRYFKKLNSPKNLEAEKKKTESLTVLAGSDIRQLKGKYFPGIPGKWLKGDGLVPEWSARLPNAENIFIHGKKYIHADFKFNPVIHAKIAEILTGIPVPARMAKQIIKKDCPD